MGVYLWGLTDVSIFWVNPLEMLLNLSSSGVLVPGGFGSRGTEGKIRAAEWARKTSKPFLGITLFISCLDLV